MSVDLHSANMQSKDIKQLVSRIENLIFQLNNNKLIQDNEKNSLLLELEFCLSNLTKLIKQVNKKSDFRLQI
jgi:hypothetical protein